MKIDDHSAAEVARVTGPANVQRVGGNFDLFAAYKTASTPGADQASLSIQGQEIQKLTDAVKALPDIRENRVKALEDKLQGGQYEVPVSDIAEAMFRLSEIDP